MIRLAVRELVERFGRSGDLGRGSAGPDRAAEGVRAHQWRQSTAPEGYRAEVPVRSVFERGDERLELSGRIDGVIDGPGGVVIEEIKTRFGPDSGLGGPVQWAQADLYAHMYVRENALDRVTVRLVRVEAGTFAAESEETIRTAAELKAWADELIGRFWTAHDRRRAWIAARDRSIGRAEFPFPLRPGQRELMDAVSGAAAGGERLVVQAPTGTGKTLGVLFPAARALAEGVVDRVFFLTARTTGRRSARTTADQLAKAGARLRTVTLTARDKVCPRPEAGCRPEECDLARGYYDRVEKALADVWTVDRPGSADLTETAARHRVCPFELSLDAALDADLIVADYNYAFDPAVRLRRFFQRPREKYLFLIDEAHQLPDRVRSMHSAALTKSAFLTLRRRVKTARPDWWAALGRVNQALLDRRKRAESEGGALVEGERPDDLVSALTDLMELAGRDLADGRPPADAGPMGWDRYFDALAYVRAARRFDPAADAAAFISRGSDASAKLICLDPARRIADTLDLAHATALFSATLSPADHYNDAFGLDDRAVRLDLDSPFPPDNLKVMIADRVSTRYRDRTRTVAEVVEMIGAAVEARTANYMVFFPSYQYLDQAAGALVHRLAGARLIRQEPNMTEKDRADFLAAFERNPPGRTLVGLAVMGGVFGESVDLVGRRLSGAVVVGLGLPGPSLERNLIRAAYDDRGGDGFEAACLYPGLTRVWQAAGRVIRSETDRGVLLFIDQRFGRIAKRGLMPWPDPLYVAGPEAVREALAGFGDDPDRGPGDSAAAEKGLQSQ